MPRHSTERQVFPINDPAIQSYFGGNGTTTTEYMKKVKSELTNKDVKSPEDKKVIKWVEDTLSQVGDAEDNRKRIAMDTEAPGTKDSVDGTKSNHFKNRKEGNDDNANPTGISTSATKVGTNAREIMSNNFGESIDKEIGGMKYLIEYMTNNK